jgi:hypothetical protein
MCVVYCLYVVYIKILKTSYNSDQWEYESRSIMGRCFRLGFVLEHCCLGMS